MYPLILVRFFPTTISFIAIVILLIELEPRKHININLNQSEANFRSHP